MRWKCWGLKNSPGFLKSSLVNEYLGHNWGPPAGLFPHFYYKLYIWDWLVDDLEIFHVIVGGCNCVWRFHPKTQERHKRQGWHGRRLNTTKIIFEVAEAVGWEIWKATPEWNEAFKKGRIVFPKMSEVVAFNPV